MRFTVRFTPNTEAVPIDNILNALNSYIHRCLGKNNPFHNTFSGYGISSPQGGKLGGDGNLVFKNGMEIVISAPNTNQDFISQMMQGVMRNRRFGYGMELLELIPTELELNEFYDVVDTISPIVVRHNHKYFTVNDDEFIELLNIKTKKKLLHLNPNLNLNNFEIEKLEIGNTRNKSRKLNIGSAFVLASQVKLKIRGPKNVRSLLYDLGIGGSTGSGFGSIKIRKPMNNLNDL